MGVGYFNRLRARARWDRYPTSYPRDGANHKYQRNGFRPIVRLKKLVADAKVFGSCWDAHARAYFRAFKAPTSLTTQFFGFRPTHKVKI